MKKISVKLEGKEVLSLDDADIYLCYKDLWLTDKERLNGLLWPPEREYSENPTSRQ